MAKLPLCLAAAALFSQLAVHAESAVITRFSPFLSPTSRDGFLLDSPHRHHRTVTIPFAFGKCEETARL
jgi:hypothetical protein